MDAKLSNELSYEALAAQVRSLQHTMDHIGAYVFTKDRQGRYTYANKMVCELFGRPLNEVVGTTDDEFFDLSIFNELRNNDRRVLDQGERIETEETNVIAETGETRVYWTVKIPLRGDHGEIAGMCGISTDITELVRLKEQFQRLANTDEMTGISSRRHLIEGAQRELNRVARTGNSLALIVFDIDNFKWINDTCGHAIGDRVICAAVGACKQNLRDIDLFGRLGGDEFVIVATATELPAALIVAERLRQGVCAAEVMGPDGSRLAISASFGVAVSNGATSFDELLSRADAALYGAKRQGRNCVWYDGQEDEPSVDA